MAPKAKFKPVIITSREAMQSVVADLVSAKLQHAAVTVEMEKEVAAVQARYAFKLDELGRTIQTQEAGLAVWAEKNRAEFFTERKSLELPQATLGFRTSPPSVQKIGKATWADVAQKLAAVVVHEPGVEEAVFVGENYVRYADPAVDKDGILRDRSVIPAEALKQAGIVIEQDETFYITPKSEVLEPSSQAAA
jgi:phage host-nuclease inhibitor protein Gam